MKNFQKLSVCFLFLVFKILNDKWSNNTGEKIEGADQQTTTDSSVGRAEDCIKDDILRSLVRVRVGGWHEKVFFEINLTNFLEGFFWRSRTIFTISLNKWSKRAKKQKIFDLTNHEKPLSKFLSVFFHLVNNVFRWKMIKQPPENTSADSSVGRAEDCRKTDILSSLVRVRVGGWHHLLFDNNCRKLLYFSKLKLCRKI